MVCANCASQLPLNAKFCDNCGAKVDSFECPRVELVSSGPMKYKKTNLDIARLDLDSVRIDLNDKFSNYVIPVSDPFENVTGDKKVQNVQKVYGDAPNPAAEQMPYVKPQRAQVYANVVETTDVRKAQNNASQYNANQSQRYTAANGSVPNAPRYNANNYPNMGNQSRSAMNQNYQQMQNRRYNANKQNTNNSDNETNSAANGVVLFIISLVAMSFLGSPVLSAIISTIVLINASKLDKSVKIKNATIGISLFVFVLSLFSIIARIGV